MLSEKVGGQTQRKRKKTGELVTMCDYQQLKCIYYYIILYMYLLFFLFLTVSGI